MLLLGIFLVPAEALCYTEMTLDNGYLGSRIDEERSKMRYLV